MSNYIVKNGETPCDVTRRFTGGSGRLSELVAANPTIPKVKVTVSGSVGAPPVVTFDPQHWGENVVVRIPEQWEGNGQVGASKYAESVSLTEGLEDEDAAANSECDAGSTISNIKEYRYEIQEDDGMGLAAITEKWGLPARKWLELAGANRQIPGKYYGSGTTRHCEPDRTKLWAGRLLKVPQIWPDPPEALWPRLKNADGTPYTPGGGGGGGEGGEGTEGIDPAKWYGTDGGGSWIWPVLAVGVFALGGVILVGATKKKGR
jgi:hypothetical protein